MDYTKMKAYHTEPGWTCHAPERDDNVKNAQNDHNVKIKASLQSPPSRLS
jgi:hypothetical protein